MQCCSSTLHYATVFYPQTHKVVKARSFQPRLSVTPPPHKTHTQETRTSHDDDKPKLITSASNPFVKHCLKLRNNSSYRRSHGSVLVVGATPIRFAPFFSGFVSIFVIFRFWIVAGFEGVLLLLLLLLLCNMASNLQYLNILDGFWFKY